MADSLAANRAAAEAAGYVQMARDAEAKYGIPQGTLLGLLETESAWRPEIISGKKDSSAGARGIAQFMGPTAEEWGVDPLDPASAIDGAGRYLSHLKKEVGSWNGALTSYNWGIGNYRKWAAGKKKSVPKEAREYAGKVKTSRVAWNGAAPSGDATAVAGAAPTQKPASSAPATRAAGADPFDTQQQQAPQRPQTGGAAQQVANVDDAVSTPSAASFDLGSADAVGMQDTARPSAPANSFKFGAAKQPDLMRQFSKQANMTIDTPQGPMAVEPENEQEARLVADLATSGETGLVTKIPAMIGAANRLASKKLMAGRGDAVHDVLKKIIRSV